MDRLERHSLWRDAQLRRARHRDRAAGGIARGRSGERAQPLSIVTPCHRVIGANGTLTGFAGGLAVKQWLLAHERGEPTLALA
ncbi:hypothetical protein GCM10020258_14950 [Sphingomonas yabuuchiae]